MIQNLARQYPVVAYDTNPKFMEDVANKSNITTAASVAAVAKQVSTVVTMLPNDKIVSSVCDTLFANLPKGTSCTRELRFPYLGQLNHLTLFGHREQCQGKLA